jgi:hypothetical protein
MGDNELMLAGAAIGGGCVLVVGGMIAYFTAENLGAPGYLGPTGIAVTASSIGGVVIAEKIGRNRHERRAVEQAHAEWLRFQGSFPAQLHYALEQLAGDMQACMLWTHPQIGIGLPPRPGFAGSWPRLMPGQDPGHKPDFGLRESPVGVRARLALPQGFSVDHVRARLGTIASSLHVPKAQVVAATGDHIVTIELRIRNPLAAVVRLPWPEPAPVPLKALRVAMREDGEFHRLRIWNNHLFLAGLTGSGKSGVLWSIIAALAPDILTGRVELHMIDLKRGSEMAAGYRLYASWAYTVDGAIATLQKIVRIMYERADPRREHAMRTGVPLRNHEATPGDPHHVVMIDEIIALIKLVGDRKGDFDVPQIDGTWKREKNIRIDKYVSLVMLELLSQGRSFGISLFVGTQNASKEIFELLRDMFSVMIGLRQASEQQVQMVYGTGAAERGIDAAAITDAEAGIGFIDSPEAGGQAMRVRFFKVEDADIMNLVRNYGRPADAPPLPVLTTLEPATGDGSAAPATATAGKVVALHAVGGGQEDDTTATGADSDRTGDRPGVPTHCLYSGCDEELVQVPGGRPKEYCSPKHRAYAKRERDRQRQA